MGEEIGHGDEIEDMLLPEILCSIWRSAKLEESRSKETSGE